MTEFLTDDDPLEVYLREVAKVPRTTAEQENRLAETIAARGPLADKAERQLVEANLWIVVDIVPQYRDSGCHDLDLIEMGNAGLMHAAATFVPARDHHFTQYATAAVHRALSELRHTG